MKFAKELEETAVAEWRASYFDYKTGKKRLKALAKALKGVPKRETHHPELPLVVRNSNNGTPVGSTGPVSALLHERSPLRPKPGQRLETHDEHPPEPQRMASYGSIIGSPPNSPATRMKSRINPVPSLELPGPAARPSAELDRSASINLPASPRPSALSLGRAASSQLAHTGNAYEIRPPTDHPVEQESTPNGGSRFRKLIPNRTVSTPLGRPIAPQISPRKSSDDNDVALESYKEADFREAEFFLFLDRELSKIEKFYKAKEDQAKDRLAALRVQLHILREKRLEEITAQEQRTRAGDVESQFLDGGQEDGPGKENQSTFGDIVSRPFAKSIDLASDAFERFRPGHIGKTSQAMRKLTTPDDSTWNHLRPEQLDYHRKSHDHVSHRDAKKKLKLATSEQYRTMELLKSYADANRKAFRKINKKYDKTVNAKPPQRYMNEQVAKAYFNTSGVVDQITTDYEDLYARYFEKGNRKVAISKLRARKNDENAHLGALIRTGALLAAGSVLSIQGVVEGTTLLFPQNMPKAEHTSFLLQLYGGYFLMFLLAMFFALATRVFAENKVNYQFIFELNRRHALAWRQIWEIPSWFFFLFGLTMYLNFNVQAGGDTMYRWWPVVLIGLSVVALFLPAPIFYHRARRWFIYTMWRLLLSGFYDVEYRDFFLGDMFCSLTYAMGGIEIFFCLYAHEWYQPAQCTSSHSKILGFLTTVPAIWRAEQCIVRWWPAKTKLFPHVFNFGKYICTIVMYMCLSFYRRHHTTGWKAAFIVAGGLNSFYTSVWDIYMDWSLGDSKAKHRWLRPTLAFRHRIWWYYAAMIIDPILRCNWIFYIIIPLGSQHSTITSFLIALSEVFRRGIWLVFRVENEHCSNIKNEKASKDLPLPYKLPDIDEDAQAATSDDDSSSDERTEDIDDKGASIRKDTGSSSDPRTPSHLTPFNLPSAGGSRSPRHHRNGRPTPSSHHTPSVRSTSDGTHDAIAPESTLENDLHRQATTGSSSSGLRRRQPSNTSANGVSDSPIVSALHRVGNTMRTAHERDYSRKKPPGEEHIDSSSEEDYDDSDDD